MTSAVCIAGDGFVPSLHIREDSSMLGNKRVALANDMSSERENDELIGAGLRQARCRMARQFLDEVLLPQISAGAKADLDIERLHASFIRHSTDLGADFDLAHVWLTACDRDLQNRRIAEQEPENLPEDALDVIVAVKLLEDVLFSTDQ